MSKSKSQKSKYTYEEEKIMDLSGRLLIEVQDHKPKELYLLIKTLGVFLASCGEAIKSGSIKEARQIRLEAPVGAQLVSPKVGVSLALMGDTIMDWSVGLKEYEINKKKERANAKASTVRNR